MLGVGLVAAGVVLLAIACGAENDVAPAAVYARPDLLKCQTFSSLLPAFNAAIASGKTDNLRILVHDRLLGNPNPRIATAGQQVLGALLRAIGTLAKAPPEPGAPAGQLCANPPPPITSANEICEMRRAARVLVHDAKGVQALKLTDPLINAILGYIVGDPTARLADGGTRPSHYEAVDALQGLCAQDAVCKLENALDLVISLTGWLETTEGKDAMATLKTTLGKVNVANFLKPDALTEDGFVAIAVALESAIFGTDPALFDKLPLPSSVQTDFAAVISLLKSLFNPAHQPDLITPIKRAITCVRTKDPSHDLTRMMYRILIRDQTLPLTETLNAVSGLQEVDPRGGLVHLLGAIAKALRGEQGAIDASALVCKAMLNTTPPAPGEKSNAMLGLPAIADLLKAGVGPELLCAMDTLVYGCAGGARPACGISAE